jgi:hypothetical protein
MHATRAHALYDAIERLDVSGVREVLTWRAALTQRCPTDLRSRGRLPFSALFVAPCREFQDYQAFLAIEAELQQAQAPVADDRHEGQPLLAGVLETAFRHVSVWSVLTEATLWRVKRWLGHPEVAQHGAHWGPSVFEVWKKGMDDLALGGLDPRVALLGRMLPPLLTQHGMPWALFDSLAATDPRRALVQPLLDAQARATQACPLMPTRAKARRLST